MPSILRIVTNARDALREDGLPGLGWMLRCRWLAFLVPTFIHGLYDFIAMIGGVLPLICFIVLILCLFLTAFLMLRRLSRQDRYL